jgi:hypothetical protein
MAPEGSHLVALAQQGIEVANHVIAVERSADVRPAEPSIGNRSGDRTKHARSEVASSASGNRRLANNDARL